MNDSTQHPSPLGYCPMCGHPRTEGANFCIQCGAALTPLTPREDRHTPGSAGPAALRQPPAASEPVVEPRLEGVTQVHFRGALTGDELGTAGTQPLSPPRSGDVASDPRSAEPGAPSAAVPTVPGDAAARDLDGPTKPAARPPHELPPDVPSSPAAWGSPTPDEPGGAAGREEPTAQPGPAPSWADAAPRRDPAHTSATTPPGWSGPPASAWSSTDATLRVTAGHGGALATAVGGAVTLLAFLTMPLISVPFIGSVTGAGLASLDGSVALLWLVPLASVAVAGIGAWQRFSTTAAPKQRALGSVWSLVLAGLVILFYIIALVSMQSQVGSTGFTGAGFWFALLGMAVAAVGATIELKAARALNQRGGGRSAA
jgi:hypothetical protein